MAIPEQEAISVAELKPYVAWLEAWIARRKSGDTIRKHLRELWKAAVTWAEGETRAHAGRLAKAYHRGTWRDILKVAGEVDADKIAMTCVAMVVMREQHPSRFKSDRAFWVQLARRFRTLTDHHVATYWDNAQGRQKRVYRNPGPRQGEYLGSTLGKTFGAVGLKIAETIHREQEEEKDRVKRALDAVQ